MSGAYLVGTGGEAGEGRAQADGGGEAALDGDEAGVSPAGEELTGEEVFGVLEDERLIDVGGDEDVGAVVAGASVVSAGVARVLEADVGVESIGQVSLGGLVLIAEGL